MFVGVVLLGLTWNRWADPQVDFGRELYLAWRLAEGDVLYEDLTSFSGPLSPHLNALAFRIFGPGVHVLLVLNGLVLATFTALAFRLLAKVAGGGAAAFACCLFLLLCGVSHYGRYGIFNFLAPYSHELTHGLLLGAIGLSLLPGLVMGQGWNALWAGVIGGIALLIKPEIALAVNGALLTGLALAVRERGRALTRFFIGVSVAPAAYLLWTAFSGRDSPAFGLTFPWIAAANGEVRQVFYYRDALGLEAPFMHLGHLLSWCLFWVSVLAVALMLDRRLTLPVRSRPYVPILVAFGVVPLAIGAMRILPPGASFAPMSLVVVGVLIAEARRCLSRSPGPDVASVVSAAGATLALLLIAKMGLRPRLTWYGFALAAPALMIFTVWISSGLPRWISPHGGAGAVRGAAVGLLLSFAVAHAGASSLLYSRKTFAFGEGRDRMLVDPSRGVALAGALEVVGNPRREGRSLLVLPEGISVNYFARRRAPGPFLNYMPPELSLFKEERMVAFFEAAPPDEVLLVPKSTDEYGGDFGTEFGRLLVEWVSEHYVESASFPGPQAGAETFVVRLLEPRRKPPLAR